MCVYVYTHTTHITESLSVDWDFVNKPCVC